MPLRPINTRLDSRRRPSRWWVGVVAALALAGCLVGLGPSGAGAGIADYSPIYLSSATASPLTTSYQLLPTAGPAAPTTAPTASADATGTGLTGKYAYEYTIVDPRGGETGPSPSSSSNSPTTDLSVTNKAIDVNGLPVGSTVRLYRACQTSATCTSTKATLYYRVAQFTVPATSPQYVDSTTDATIITNANIMPQTQNRPAASQTGYYKFVPGVALLLRTATTAPVGSPAFSGEGWVVDNPGGVRFAAGTWTFTARFSGTAGANNAASLDVGMWIVDNTGAKVGGPIIDPTGAGDDTSTNIAQSATTASPVTATVTNVPALDVESNQHLYVQFWRHQTQSNSSTITTLYSSDGSTPTIGHPAATSVPDVPPVLAPTPDGLRANVTTPQLKATYTDGDANSGTLTFQVCTDAPCNTTYVSHTTGALASNMTATWNTPALPDGTYYWKVQATDTVNNTTTWSAVHSFTVDTTPPSAPALVSPADAVRTNQTTPALTATYTDTPSGGTGTLSYQLCPQPPLPGPCLPGTAASVSNGSNGSWAPGSALADGTYTWKVQATDAATNVSSWSSTHSFVVDTHPPVLLSSSGPSNGAWLRTLPSLSGRFGANGDSGDSGTIIAQLCASTDPTCAGPTFPWSGSSASGIADNGTGSVTPSPASNGTYYWRVQAKDAAGNVSAWSSPVTSFIWDNTPPATPTPSPAIAARVQAAPTLTVPYSDPQFADSGTVTFEICRDAACALVLQSNVQTSVASGTNPSWTPSFLADGLYYWKVISTDTAGNNATATGSFTVDTVPPGVPTLVSPAAGGRTNTPTLGATFVDSDLTDSGTVTFQLCNDAACSTSGAFPVASPASAVVSNSGGVSWAATGGPYADGTYYWRARSTDVAGNVGAWSSTHGFVIDTTVPSVPTLDSVTARVSTSPQLSASFSDPDAPDTGTILFQVCSDSSCSSVIASGSSAAGVANGGKGTWTPVGLAAGSYYWRGAAKDAAGNQSAWSGTGQFAFDTTPPSVPTVSAPADGVRLNQPPSLSAVYADTSAGVGDSGTLTFEICPTSSCTTPFVTKTSGSLVSGDSDSWTPSIGDGTYYWRVAAQDAAGNGSAWTVTRSFTVDSTPPNAPELVGAPGMRVRTSPALTARVSDPSDPGDSARIYVEVCADPGCATVLASGYSGTVPVGTLAGWAAPALVDGTYYWRTMAEDVVGNQSGWSGTRSFLVDDSAPALPAVSGPTDAALVNTIQLTGVFSSSDAGDSGTLEFQLCADEACASVVDDGSAGPVASGGKATWTADTAALDDGVYFWRVRAKDAAGNESPWSATRSLTLDDTPPGPPQDFRATIAKGTLTLTWRPPANPSTVRGYALIVNGKKTQTMTAKTLKLRIHLRRHETRTFAIAAVDRAGNMSDATRTIEAAGDLHSVKQARAAAVRRHR